MNELALYLRLSVEDGDLVDESNSIKNQRSLVLEYVAKLGFSNYKLQEYIDDGFSGKNFNRPGVQELFKNVKQGIVKVIIVKDLSRFGRNYLEVGDYIEKIFPALEVRFIAINNGFDSNDYLGTTPGIDTNFLNLVNDYYSEENAYKLRKDFWRKRQRGEFIAALAPLGYEKSINNHNRLVMDEYAAAIIYNCFTLTRDLGSYEKAAREMQRLGYPTPQLYKMSQGVDFKWRYNDSQKKWSGGIVRRIVNNREYLGCIVHHTRAVIEVGSKKTKHINYPDWEVVPGHHKAIITEELYDAAHKSIEENKKKKGVHEQRRMGEMHSPIKGLVKCGNCRHNLTRRPRMNPTYYCKYRYSQQNTECCKGNIREDELLPIIYESVNKQILLLGEVRRMIEKLDSDKKEEDRINKNEITKLQREIATLKNQRLQIYEELMDGSLSNSEFIERKGKISLKIADIEERIAAYETMSTDSNTSQLYEFFKSLEPYQTGAETVISEEVIRLVINAVYVYNDKRIEIAYNFTDKFREIAELSKKLY